MFNAEKLQAHLINQIALIKPVKENAFVNVSKFSESSAKKNPDVTVPGSIPQRFFKYYEVEEVSDNQIHLLAENWPVNSNDDGCSTNNLSEDLGILSPSIRCVAHAADGSIKRMVNSKTMNVPDIREFLPYFCTILRHFQLSGKCLVLLNEALEILELKTVHMMTFCPSRMNYLLQAYTQVTNILDSVCDVLTTIDIKEEERSYFMSPKCMIILHLLADLETVFTKHYLRKLDVV